MTECPWRPFQPISLPELLSRIHAFDREVGEKKIPQYLFTPFDASSTKENALKVIDDKMELPETRREELERIESLELEAKLASAAHRQNRK